MHVVDMEVEEIQAPDATHGARVLVVEDSPTSRLEVSSILRSGGFDIYEAESGREALSLVETLQPELVLLDVQLPDIHGFEVCRQIKEMTNNLLPVLHLSAAAISTEERISGLESGADAYLTSPVSPRELVAQVRSLLRIHRAEKALHDALHRSAEAERQLLHSRRVESLGRISGGVAHEFNNLLMVMTNFTSFVKDSLEPSDSRVTDLEEVLNAGERGSSLVRKLLTFARSDPSGVNDVDLNESVLGMENVFRRTLGEDLDLILDLHPDELQVHVDGAQFEQVLLNLVLNARQALPDGGSVLIKTGIGEVSKEGHASLHIDAAPGIYAWASVTDDGPGIPSEIIDLIFEPFFTTKKQGEGTGLGLSTVFGIVKHSGGAVVVSSPPDRGATFTVYLPLVGQPPAGSGGQPPRKEPARDRLAKEAGPRTILIAEDEDGVRKMILRVLSTSGHRVLAASSGKEALELLTESDLPVDVLITDVIMPGMSGRDLADELGRLSLGVPVIFMSGYSANLLPAGIPPGTLLEKPFTRDELLDAVDRVLALSAEAADPE